LVNLQLERIEREHVQVTPRKKIKILHRNEPAGDGFRVAGKYTKWWMVGARSESHYCTREPLPGPEHARNEDLLLQ
jgi:hypothetical protein